MVTAFYKPLMSRYILISLVVALVTLVGCAGGSPGRISPPPEHTATCCRSVEAKSLRPAIVRTASRLVGAKTIDVDGRRIAYDCAGVTRAIYLQHGIDLYEGGHPDARANGVKLIHDHIRQHGKLHQGPLAHPGDLVFFDNTWDFNRDGLNNDPLTHVGIVERQEADGTITFISRVAGAIARYRMNLGLPHIHRTADGKVLNDYIRRKDGQDPFDTAYLTGQLFAGFGTRTGL